MRRNRSPEIRSGSEQEKKDEKILEELLPLAVNWMKSHDRRNAIFRALDEYGVHNYHERIKFSRLLHSRLPRESQRERASGVKIQKESWITEEVLRQAYAHEKRMPPDAYGGDLEEDIAA